MNAPSPDDNKNTNIPPMLNLQLTLLHSGISQWFPKCICDWERFSTEALALLHDPSFAKIQASNSAFAEKLAKFVRQLYMMKLLQDCIRLPMSVSETSRPDIQKHIKELRARMEGLDHEILRIIYDAPMDMQLHGSLQAIASSASALVFLITNAISDLEDRLAKYEE